MTVFNILDLLCDVLLISKADTNIEYSIYKPQSDILKNMFEKMEVTNYSHMLPIGDKNDFVYRGFKFILK